MIPVDVTEDDDELCNEIFSIIESSDSNILGGEDDE